MIISKMTEQVRLSILVPAYNVEKYIAECLDSIEYQLTDECEVIVYDDASTDSTLDIIQNTAIYHKPNFRLIKGKVNKGLSFARNTLKDNCYGEYIWFMDSDDKILDGAVKKILECTLTSKPDTIFFNHNNWPEKPTKRELRKGLEAKSYIGPVGYHTVDSSMAFSSSVKSRNLHAPSKVYRKALFRKETDFPVGRIFEDICVTPLLASLSNTIFYLDEPLFAYRRRAGSILSSMKTESEIERLKSILDLKKRYECVHGPMCETALSAITYFSAHQLRDAIKNTIKSSPEHMKTTLLQRLLLAFKNIHNRSFFYVMRTCYKEEGLHLCFHVGKRIIQAQKSIRRSKFT